MIIHTFYEDKNLDNLSSHTPNWSIYSMIYDNHNYFLKKTTIKTLFAIAHTQIFDSVAKYFKLKIATEFHNDRLKTTFVKLHDRRL